MHANCVCYSDIDPAGFRAQLNSASPWSPRTAPLAVPCSNQDFFISGLAPLNDMLVLLAYVVDESGGSKGAERPELR